MVNDVKYTELPLADLRASADYYVAKEDWAWYMNVVHEQRERQFTFYVI